MKGPTLGLSQQVVEAEGSLTREAPGRVGAALTTPGRFGTARRAGSGKRDRTVCECRNQRWNPLKRMRRLEPGGCGPDSRACPSGNRGGQLRQDRGAVDRRPR